VRVPPPSAALERALADLRPVRTRRPGRVVIGVAGASLAYAGALVWKLGLRSDWPRLPLGPLALYAAAGLSTFFALLGSALVPPRGQVLPRRTTGGRSTVLMLGALIALDLAMVAHPLAAHAPPAMSLDGSLAAAARCLGTSFSVAVATVALGLWSLRRVGPMAGWRGLVALGGAAGALADLVLHLHCATSNPAHVGLVHGAALALPAALLAVAAPDRLPSQADRNKSVPVPRHDP